MKLIGAILAPLLVIAGCSTGVSPVSAPDLHGARTTPAAAASPAVGASPALDESAEQNARFERWRASLPPVSGPYPVVREEPYNLSSHTVFRPANIAGRVPVVAFANGGCRNTPIEFTAFLAELASRGYFIVAVGRGDVPFAGVTREAGAPAPTPSRPLQVWDAAIMTAGVDWAAAEDKRRGGAYENRLDLTRVAMVGQSCGGIQALVASRDPRTKTTVVLNSGTFPATPGSPSLPIPGASDLDLDTLHAPIAYFPGGPSDMAYKNALANYEAIKTRPVAVLSLPVGHTGAYPQPDPRWVSAVAAWLDWTLKGDQKARAEFVGDACGLCRNPDWTVSTKHLN